MGGLWPRMEDPRPRGVGLASPERDGGERLAVFLRGVHNAEKAGALDCRASPHRWGDSSVASPEAVTM